MGGKTVTNNTSNETRKVEPPSWALPGLESLASRITSIIPSVPGQKYEGDFIAPPNQTQYSALPLFAAASLAAMGAGGLAGTTAAGLPNFTPSFQGASAPTFAGGPSPTFAGGAAPNYGAWDSPRFDTTAAAQAATAPILRNLTENVLPSLQSSALASGAYGNTRMTDILPSLVIRDAARGAQEIGSQMAFAEHNAFLNDRLAGFNALTSRGLGEYGMATERGLGAFGAETARGLGTFGALTERGLGEGGLRLQAQSMLPSMLDTQLRMATGAGDILSQAGSMQQAWDQSAIDNQLAKFDYGLRYPFQGLDTASQLLAALAHGYGTTTGTSTSRTTQSSGGLAPALGGLIGLGGMIAGFPGVGGLFRGSPAPAPIIPGGFQIGQGWAQQFSDRRLKRDVLKVGEFEDGLGVYLYRYLWSPLLRLGVMADEVAALRPQALGPEVDGFATVLYGRL